MLLMVSFTSIIGMIVGIIFGIILVFFIYMIYVIKAINEVSISIDDEFVSKALDESIKQYKKSHYSTISDCLSGMINGILDLKKKITFYLFPKSTNPTLEITVKQTLDLSLNISNRVDELLNKKSLAIFKKLKISQLIQLSIIKKKIDNSFIMRINSKYQLTGKFGFIKGILNFINPVYWIKKILMDTIIIFILRKICVKILEISAQEIYNAYNF